MTGCTHHSTFATIMLSCCRFLRVIACIYIAPMLANVGPPWQSHIPYIACWPWQSHDAIESSCLLRGVVSCLDWGVRVCVCVFVRGEGARSATATATLPTFGSVLALARSGVAIASTVCEIFGDQVTDSDNMDIDKDIVELSEGWSRS